MVVDNTVCRNVKPAVVFRRGQTDKIIIACLLKTLNFAADFPEDRPVLPAWETQPSPRVVELD
jgi:hypothetical protein